MRLRRIDTDLARVKIVIIPYPRLPCRHRTHAHVLRKVFEILDADDNVVVGVVLICEGDVQRREVGDAYCFRLQVQFHERRVLRFVVESVVKHVVGKVDEFVVSEHVAVRKRRHNALDGIIALHFAVRGGRKSAFEHFVIRLLYGERLLGDDFALIQAVHGVDTQFVQKQIARTSRFAGRVKYRGLRLVRGAARIHGGGFHGERAHVFDNLRQLFGGCGEQRSVNNDRIRNAHRYAVNGGFVNDFVGARPPKRQPN